MLVRPVRLSVPQAQLVQQQVRSTVAKHLTVELKQEMGSKNSIGLPMIEDSDAAAEVLLLGGMMKEQNRN